MSSWKLPPPSPLPPHRLYHTKIRQAHHLQSHVSQRSGLRCGSNEYESMVSKQKATVETMIIMLMMYEMVTACDGAAGAKNK